MKTSCFVAFLLLSCSAATMGADSWPDTFLDPSIGYADPLITLGDVYLALPQNLFELTYRQRLELLIGGVVQFDGSKKQIIVPGEGAQSRLTIHVVEQSHEKLTLDVVAEREDAMLHYTLERTPNGWTSTENH